MDWLIETVARYGPLAIVVGMLIEGETVVIVAGFLSFQGVLDPVVAAACAAFGAFLSDQICFSIGRQPIARPLARRIARHPLFGKVTSAIEDHPRKFIVTVRFIYGMRTVGPVAAGLTTIPRAQFMIYDAIATIVWGAAFTALGYMFGEALETALGHAKTVKAMITGTAGIAVAVFAAYQLGVRLWRKYRRNGRAPAE